MSKTYANTKWTMKELSLEILEEDFNQPRKFFGMEGDQENNRLIRSLHNSGIEEPLKVLERQKKDGEEKRYIIIDGHRRYRAVTKLGWETVPCCVYKNMSVAEMETRRYQIQNNRRPWSPIEKSQSINTIKQSNALRFDREVAELIGLSPTSVSNSLRIRDLSLSILGKLSRYELNDSYHQEIVRLQLQLRKVGGYEINEIVDNIIERIHAGAITSAKELRLLGRVFRRAAANKRFIVQFLDNKDMAVEELASKTDDSSFMIILEKTMEEIKDKQQAGVEFSRVEKKVLQDIIKLVKCIK